MAEQQGPPPLPPGGGGAAADWTRGLSSFDAASFFEAQQRQQEEQRTAQGQQLRAAADLLLPSSSESESDSGDSGDEAQEQAGRAAGGAAAAAAAAAEGSPERRRRRRRSRSRSASSGSEDGRGGRRGKQRRRKDGKERRKESERERRRRKEKEKRQKQRESEREQQVRLERQTGAAQRASQVKSWATGKEGAGEPYYFDTRGDPANLAFGGLYRMDVARYRRVDPAGFAASLGVRRRGPGTYGVRQLATEADGHAQRDRSRRYFGAPTLRAERNAHLKRWRRSLQEGAAAAAAAGGGGDGSVALGLLAVRKLPGQAQQAAQQGRRLDLPSPAFMPLEVEADAEGPPRPGAAGAAGTAAPGPAMSAAAELAAEQAAARRRQGETNEELLLRRTREFNEATRERPHDIQLWLRFARFQDEALKLGPARRGGERSAAEKKIAILEKALGLHPGSDELLLALLHAAEAVCDSSELERRWRAVLARHAGSPRLWRAYLHHRRTQFTGFSAAEVAATYDDAFAALHREHTRRARQGAPADVLGQLEAEAAAIVLEGTALRLAAGATERAVAALQVLLEFNWFAPEGWPADALEVMFEEYWLSGAPMIGEFGGAGWAAWMAGESPLAAAAAAAAAPGSTQRQRRAAQQMQDLDDEAARAGGKQQGGKQTGGAVEGTGAAAGADGSSAKGWSGWEELAPAIRARFGHSLQLGGEGAAEAAAAGEGEEAGDEEGAGEGEEAAVDDLEPPAEEEEETEEQLLERLGLRLEEALEEAPSELSPPLLDRWLATERSREGQQWQPRRAEAAEAAAAAARAAEFEEFGPLSDAEEEEVEEEEAPHRSVAWRDVRRLLWRFESPAARQQLLAGCLRLLGAPVPGSLPSNSAAAAAAASGCDELWWAAAVAGCFSARCNPNCSRPGSGGWAADLLGQGDWSWLLGGSTSGTPPGLRHRPWYRDGGGSTRRAVLTQLLTALLRGPCRRDAGLAAALLVSHLDVGSRDELTSLIAPQMMVSSGADELAKQLLAEQRTNLALWQAYAQLQVASGSLRAARKVYQTCFATVGAPSGLAAAAAAAPLVLGAVQLELLGDIQTQGAAALPSAGAAAPAWSGCSLLPWLSELCPPFGPLAAARQLAWLGSGGAVALPGPPSAGPPAALEPQDIVAAKRGFQDLLLSLLRQQQEAQQQQQQRRQGGNGGVGSGSLSAGGRALVTAAAAFEQLVGHLRGDLAGGVKAALAIYEQVLAALLPPPAQLPQPGQPAGPADPGLEILAWQRCQLAADAAQRALPCAPPAAVRQALLRALRSFPASPALLQLLVAHEAAGHTLAQLRRELHGLVELAPSPQVWLAMLAAEVSTRSPGAAVQSVLERAVSHESGRHCPLLWRLYLQFEAHRGRHDAVKRLFLRAIGACPWAKALWCDGLALLNGRAPPKELSEYIEVMKDKELVLRTDVFEVLLQQLEAQQGAAAAAGGDQPAAAGGADASG